MTELLWTLNYQPSKTQRTTQKSLIVPWIGKLVITPLQWKLCILWPFDRSKTKKETRVKAKSYGQFEYFAKIIERLLVIIAIYCRRHYVITITLLLFFAYLFSSISENVADFLRVRSCSSSSSFLTSTTLSIMCSTRFLREDFQLSKFWKWKDFH